MASIHSLPVELLARIFTLGTRDPLADFSSPAAPIPRDPPFELLVSHVCLHWRAVALRTPLLWTSIVLTQPSHIPRARAYVSRSARLPFHILFDSASEGEYVPGRHIFRDEFLPAFEPLTPHIDRWRSLILRVRDLPCKRHARTVLSTVGPAPQLRALELWHIEEWSDADRLWGHVGPPPVVVFNGALPVLCRLSLIGVNIQWSHASSPFLRNLSELELGVHSDDVRIPFDRWLDVLRDSPRLQRLSLHYSGPRIAAVPWRLPDGPVVLPTLRDLKLADLDATYACALLRTFVAPNVRKLHLELGSMSDTPQDYTAFVDMLVDAPDPAACPPLLDPAVVYSPLRGEDTTGEARARTMFPALEELTIASLATCTLASWHALLRGAPHLHTLAVDFTQMDAGAFDVLAGALVPPLPVVTHYRNGAYYYRVDPYVALAEAAGLTGREADSRVGVEMVEMVPELLLMLGTLRVAGVCGKVLARYWRARRRMGKPLGRVLVNVKDRDREMERLKVEVEAEAKARMRREEEPCRMEWFNEDEDEDEVDEQEDGVDDETEGTAEEGGEDDQGDPCAYVPGSGSDDTSSEDPHHHHPHPQGVPGSAS